MTKNKKLRGKKIFKVDYPTEFAGLQTHMSAYNTSPLKPRWHSWIARSPPKGQVAGSNPAWGANPLS